MHKMDVEANIDPFSDSLSTNLFRGDVIFKLFNNLQSIIIDDGYGFYQFSFSYLSNMIFKSTSLQRIVIKSSWRGGLACIWSSTDRKLLLWMFNQFDIQYDENGSLPIGAFNQFDIEYDPSLGAMTIKRQ